MNLDKWYVSKLIYYLTAHRLPQLYLTLLHGVFRWKKYDEICFRRHDGIKDQFEETTATRSETRRKELTTIINIAKPLSTYSIWVTEPERDGCVPCVFLFFGVDHREGKHVYTPCINRNPLWNWWCGPILTWDFNDLYIW